MTDLNKLREKFERLQHIADKLESVYYCETIGCYTEKSGYKFCSVSSFLNGAWYAYKKQQAKFDLYMNDFRVAANCVKSQQKTIDALRAQLDRAEKDSERIDFLADKEQWIVNVQMPREIVERNLSSLRDAIDRAMDLVAQEQNND